MKQDILDGFRLAMDAGKSRDEVIGDMNRNGLTIMEAIRAARELFTISLGEAKHLVSQHPDYIEIADAAVPFQESLIQSSEDLANDQLKNH